MKLKRQDLYFRAIQACGQVSQQVTKDLIPDMEHWHPGIIQKLDDLLTGIWNGYIFVRTKFLF